MLLYFVFVLLLVLMRYSHIKSQQCVRLLFVYLFLLLALRSWDIGLNDTRNVYHSLFIRISDIPDLKTAIIDSHLMYEPLMSIYVWIITRLTSNFQIFIAISAFFPIVAMNSLISHEQNKKLVYLSVLYFFSMYFFYASFMIKQYIAVSIIVFSYRYLKEENYKKYFLCVVIAALFHKSAWVLLAIIPLVKWMCFNKKTYLIIGALIGFGVVFSDSLLTLIFRLDPTGLYEHYFNHGIYSSGGRAFNLGMIIYVVILVLCAVRRRYVSPEKYKKYNNLLILSSLNCIVNSYSGTVTEFYRLAIYFGVFNCLLIPNAIETIQNTRYKKNMEFLCIVVMIVYGLSRSAYNSNCVPYKFFWQ